jgi:hypothetical protein
MFLFCKNLECKSGDEPTPIPLPPAILSEIFQHQATADSINIACSVCGQVFSYTARDVLNRPLHKPTQQTNMENISVFSIEVRCAEPGHKAPTTFRAWSLAGENNESAHMRCGAGFYTGKCAKGHPYKTTGGEKIVSVGPTQTMA